MSRAWHLAEAQKWPSRGLCLPACPSPTPDSSARSLTPSPTFPMTCDPTDAGGARALAVPAPGSARCALKDTCTAGPEQVGMKPVRTAGGAYESTTLAPDAAPPRAGF